MQTTTFEMPQQSCDSSINADSPLIRKLSIKGYRGIPELEWHPKPGLNLILGGGDVGKTTILEAISLLLCPTNTTVLSDTDYWQRKTEHGFEIEAVMAIPQDMLCNTSKQIWPWVWDESLKDARVPEVLNEDETPPIHQQAVYKVRVRGTEELELAYEIVEPNENIVNFTVSLRRKIGLVRLIGDDRNGRDLRLVQGSALDRLMSDKSLRPRFTELFSKDDITKQLRDKLGTESKKALEGLDKELKKQNLPSKLDLGLSGGPGISIGSLIGLTAESTDGTRLPLSTWGAGTRRLVTLSIDDSCQHDCPIIVVDEVEKGLEPYRQRLIIKELESGNSQVFITTHSPFIISTAQSGTLWYLNPEGKIGCLDKDKITKHQANEPETFLARLPIVAEGKTEKGFVSELFERSIGKNSLLKCGIYVANGDGNNEAILLLKALSRAGLKFGGFIDDDGNDPETCKSFKANNVFFFQWEKGCLEENIINVTPDDKLKDIIEDPSGSNTSERMAILQRRLKHSNKDITFESNTFEELKTKACDGLRQLIIEAALGKVPSDITEDSERKMYKNQSKRFFKTEEGGRELAGKVFSLGLQAQLSKELIPFINSIRKACNLENLTSL